MKNIYIIAVTLLLVFLVFKNDILEYTESLNVKSSVSQEDIDFKKNKISLIFDRVEVSIFGDSPVGPDKPKPKPGDKCLECKGTGVIVQGDGHVTACVPCDGKGIFKDVISGIDLLLKRTNDEMIEDRYENIFGFKDDPKQCVDGESCEIKGLEDE